MEEGSFFREIKDRPDRLFVIGDIHGHADEVSTLLDFLVGNKGCSEQDQLIFIGDYIDRGPSSRLVIERMLEIRREFPKTVFLKGNHEEMLLGFLGLGGQYGEYYLKNGGATFFESYGIETIGSLNSIREQIPESHINFIRNLELGVSLGEFVFVHAGVSPRRALNKQTQEDLLWIREEFIQHPHSFGKIVVFGHTAFNQVFLDLPFRIGIDTGVAYGNKLSAVELVHGELYQVDVGGRSITQIPLKQLLPPTS